MHSRLGPLTLCACTAASLGLASAAVAQSERAETLFSALIEQCDLLMDAPGALMRQALADGEAGFSTTSDGLITSAYSVVYPDPDQPAYINLWRTDLPGGTTVNCYLSVYGEVPGGDDQPMDPSGTIENSAPDILGPDFQRIGGEIVSFDDQGATIVWTTADWPPSTSIILFESDAFTSMTINRNLPN